MDMDETRISAGPGAVTIDAIAVATGIAAAEIAGPSRLGPVVAARRMVAHALHHGLGWSSPRIGRALGGRDHSSVLHALRVIPLADRLRAMRIAGPVIAAATGRQPVADGVADAMAEMDLALDDLDRQLRVVRTRLDELRAAQRDAADSAGGDQ